MPPPAAASAASSCRNSGLPPLRSYSAVSSFGRRISVAEQLRGELVGVARPSGCRVSETMVVRSLCGGHTTSLPGRIAVTNTNGSPAERGGEVLEQVDNTWSAQCRSSIDSTSGRVLRTQLEHRARQRDGSMLRARAALELVDRRRVPEQVHEHLDHALDLGVVGARRSSSSRA